MQTPYDADYFLNGVASGKSNYVQYSWKEVETMALAKRISEVMAIDSDHTFLDWGCARGYVVKAMRRLGTEAFGYDISEWAIENCDPEVKDFVSRFSPYGPCDHAFLKDLCEHLDMPTLIRSTEWLLSSVRQCILVIVPLTAAVGGSYIRCEDDMDVTHKIRWPLQDWMNFFHGRMDGNEWTMQGSWHIPGLKPTSLSHPKSCGFITLRRI